MLHSEDGLICRKRGVFQETAGDETAFLFESEDSVLCLGRHGQGRQAQLPRARPPYRSWERTSRAQPIGGPLVAKWGERYLVAAASRQPTAPRKTALYGLVPQRLIEFAQLPDGGDIADPGFVELSPTRGPVSYYSSHETDAADQPIPAIELAALSLDE